MEIYETGLLNASVYQAKTANEKDSAEQGFAQFLEEEIPLSEINREDIAGITVQKDEINAVTETEKAASEKDVTEENSGTKSARQEFFEYMEKTPAERIREAILKKHGLTEESFEKLPPEEKEKIEKEIEEQLRAEFKKDAEENADKQKPSEMKSTAVSSKMSDDVNKTLMGLNEISVNSEPEKKEKAEMEDILTSVINL